MNDELQTKIEDRRAEGWELKEERTNSATMIRRKTGTIGAHAIIFVLVGWWTLGFANFAYLAYKYFIDVDVKRLRTEDDAEA